MAPRVAICAESLWTALPASPKHAPPGASATGAQIAQLVEQRIENPRVAGSIPALGTTLNNFYYSFEGVISNFLGSIHPCIHPRVFSDRAADAAENGCFGPASPPT